MLCGESMLPGCGEDFANFVVSILRDWKLGKTGLGKNRDSCTVIRGFQPDDRSSDSIHHAQLPRML